MRAWVWVLAGCGRVGFAPIAGEGGRPLDDASGLVDAAPATVDAPPCSTVKELATDFGGVMSPAWTTVMDPGITLSESSNHLVVQIPTNKIASGGYNSACTYDMTGQRVWVTIARTPNAGTTTDIYLGLGTPSKAMGLNVTGGSIDAYKLIGSYSALASIPYNATQHKVFQIRESGGQVFWEVSADGTSFTQVHSAAPPFSLTSVNVFIFADAYMPANNPGQGEFAKFGL